RIIPAGYNWHPNLSGHVHSGCPSSPLCAGGADIRAAGLDGEPQQVGCAAARGQIGRSGLARAELAGAQFAVPQRFPQSAGDAVLFYVLTILALMTRHADLLFVIMAWIFVALRIVHAYIHVTDNYMPRRGV